MQTVNFRDSFNPAILNQYDAERRAGDAAYLESPIWQAIRGAATYEPYLQVAPEAGQLIEKRSTYEGRFYVTPGAFLIAVSTFSAQVEGFTWNVTDHGSGAGIFNQNVSNKVSEGGTVEGVTRRVILLTRPRPITEPGLLSANITNRSASDNLVQLVLWFVVPEQQPELNTVPNAFDAYLQAEIEKAGRITRQGGAWTVSPTGAPIPPAELAAAGSAAPWEVMPAGGRPFRYDEIRPAPAAGTDDYPIIDFYVPSGYTCAIKRHGHRYLGPGFVDGSGNLIFRIEVDGAHPPGYDDMRTTVWTEEVAGAILAQAAQRVRYTVTTHVDATLGDEIQCYMQGFFYPSR